MFMLQIQRGCIKQPQLLFLYSLHPLCFQSSSLTPALNFNGFFSDANDYFASYPLTLIACEGALWQASLSCHSLERHVNCTYRLFSGVTHHHWHKWIWHILTPTGTHLFSLLIEIVTSDWIFSCTAPGGAPWGQHDDCVAVPFSK